MLLLLLLLLMMMMMSRSSGSYCGMQSLLVLHLRMRLYLCLRHQMRMVRLQHESVGRCCGWHEMHR